MTATAEPSSSTASSPAAPAAAPAPPDWFAANQRHLTVALGRIRALLEEHIARSSAGGAGASGGSSVQGTAGAQGAGVAESRTRPAPDATNVASQRADPSARDSAVPGNAGAMALDVLAGKFRLSPFERDVLLLCAGVELDARIGSLCASAHGDGNRRQATFGLALSALPGAHWSAVTPASPLRRWRLINVDTDAGLTSTPIRIDERVLHFLAGVPHLDDRLACVVEGIREPTAIAPTHREVVDRVCATWSVPRRGPVPVVQLVGDGGADKRAIAAAACAAFGLRVYALPASAIPTGAAELETFVRLWEREAALGTCALLVEHGDLDEPEAKGPALTHFLERTWGVLLLSSPDRRRTGERASVAFEVRRPSAEEQRIAWTGALGDAATRLNGRMDQLVSQFTMSAQTIQSVAAEMLARPQLDDDVDFASAVWSGCRLHARPRLDGLAQRIESSASWDDLVLPDAQRQILRDLAAHVRNRATVYERWGFGGQGERGLGISALFAGASGTGKTMAAEVLGSELHLDVYRIDLSAVVSKYIGETEKNLRRIFDAAEEGGAILLFDEADALFGKRSDVKDSHDRYANIEVSYLLQRMECYRGLAILTTNLKSALDTAFLRRIRFIVQFPYPDAEQRAEIWRKIFPRATPTDGLDYRLLAQLNVAGGNIRSIALNAAFLAADAAQPIQMSHVLRAARSEYAKLEKPLTEAEVEGWAD